MQGVGGKYKILKCHERESEVTILEGLDSLWGRAESSVAQTSVRQYLHTVHHKLAQLRERRGERRVAWNILNLHRHRRSCPRPSPVEHLQQ